jgi:tripartite-type tricarboxylate transporter receptor subunit TctC
MRIRMPAILAFFVAACAHAQGYPVKPITLILPFAAGGPGDVLARNLASVMGKQLKQTIVVENVGGAGGNIGTARVAKAAPDGYTLLEHNIGMATSPALYRKLDYNPLTDFEYIGLAANIPMMLVARNGFPARDFKDFLAYVKANKGKVSIANGGVGGASHLCGLLFMSTIQADLITVPYKGGGPAMNDVLGGQVDLMCEAIVNTTANVKAGKVRAIGITTMTRSAALPEVPTLDELGLKGFEVVSWNALYAPKRTPKPVIDRLVAALQAALRDPDLKANIAPLGAEPVAQNLGTPAALAAYLKEEIDKWGPIIRNAGIYVD